MIDNDEHKIGGGPTANGPGAAEAIDAAIADGTIFSGEVAPPDPTREVVLEALAKLSVRGGVVLEMSDGTYLEERAYMLRHPDWNGHGIPPESPVLTFEQVALLLDAKRVVK